MALGILAIMYLIVAAAGIAGLLVMFLAKNEKIKKFTCFLMALWGMFIATCNALSFPANWLIPQAFSFGFGFVGVVGLVIRIMAKNKKQILFAKLLTTVSVACGTLIFIFI